MQSSKILVEVMTGKHTSIDQKTEALTLRAAGYTITVISDKTGVSVSTLKRLFNEHGITRGILKKDAVVKAGEALIHDANVIDTIKKEVAALILDDVAIAKRLRQAMVEATEQLSASDTAEALQVMRAVSSGAVALKSTSETLRKSLGIDKDADLTEELPELTISIMTDVEVEAVKEQARARIVALVDSSDLLDEVVEYSDEKELVCDAVD